MSLNIDQHYNETENFWLIKLEGEIDIYTANKLKEVLTNIFVKNISDIKFDFSELTYLDSTGLGVLIWTLKKIKKTQKSIIIKNAKPNILKLLKITALDKIFIVDNQ
ncbi:STAS domain-containing protein [Lutibacter sp. B2]|nr:STAS domain-containing protein [Lutibacter sp. B2]